MATDSHNSVRPTGFLGLKRIHICDHERGILWTDGECTRLLSQGTTWFFDPLGKIRVSIYNRRAPWLADGVNEKDGDTGVILDSGVADGELTRLVLGDNQLAVARVDGRYNALLGPGVHAWWKSQINVDVSVRDIDREIEKNNGRVAPSDAAVLLADSNALSRLTVAAVPAKACAAMYRNGKLVEMLQPGRHVFWSGVDTVEVQYIDMREQTVDINGQELLTSDKLSIRLNALLSYSIVDAEKSLSVSDLRQVIYREAQLVIRGEVGMLSLDELLSDRSAMSEKLSSDLSGRVAPYGVSVISFGVRDVILPGDVKNLLMKVSDARASSEASTLLRREETAAMRHQLNTARLLSGNPALMRLRELETVEKIAEGGKLTVVLGDKGLAERVSDML